MSIICDIFHWGVYACVYCGSGYFWLRSVCVLYALTGALCCGGTSRSVCILREMATEEVGLTLAFVCYILVVVSWLRLRCLQRAFE